MTDRWTSATGWRIVSRRIVAIQIFADPERLDRLDLTALRD
jgi:hypothetical protein